MTTINESDDMTSNNTTTATNDLSKSSAFGYDYEREKPPVSARLQLLRNLGSEVYRRCRL